MSARAGGLNTATTTNSYAYQQSDYAARLNAQGQAQAAAARTQAYLNYEAAATQAQVNARVAQMTAAYNQWLQAYLEAARAERARRLAEERARIEADRKAYDIRVAAEKDPLFGYSVRPHVSLDRPCHAGETAISVRGDGTVRRCHFIDEPIGNLYDGSWRRALRPRDCTNAVCDCHIGYVHLKPLGLWDGFAGESWNVSQPPGQPPGFARSYIDEAIDCSRAVWRSRAMSRSRRPRPEP